MKLDDWKMFDLDSIKKRTPIWTDWSDGWHSTCFEGLYVRFKVTRVDFCEMDMYEIDGAIENTTPPANPRQFRQRVPYKEVEYIKAFKTPLDMFKHIVEMFIRDELPEKVPCLELVPNYMLMNMPFDKAGLCTGFCELQKGHEGSHRSGKFYWKEQEG